MWLGAYLLRPGPGVQARLPAAVPEAGVLQSGPGVLQASPGVLQSSPGLRGSAMLQVCSVV